MTFNILHPARKLNSSLWSYFYKKDSELINTLRLGCHNLACKGSCYLGSQNEGLEEQAPTSC